MLLFSRLYNSSIHKFNRFINNLIELNEILEFGIKFSQQEKGVHSVPDGIFFQESIKVAIETKTHGCFDEGQLINHLGAFGNENRKILIALSPVEMDSNLKEKIKLITKNKEQSIQFINLTFKQTVQKFKETIDENYDIELYEIISDYEEYCLQSNLIQNNENLMRVMLCGQTLDLNIKNGCYYNLAERGYKEHAYMGMYKEKAVRAFGKISNIIAAELIEGELKIITSKNKATDCQKERIINMIIDTKGSLGWDISTKHEFFMVDELHEIEFKKSSKGAPLGAKFFDLKEYLEDDEINDEKLMKS